MYVVIFGTATMIIGVLRQRRCAAGSRQQALVQASHRCAAALAMRSSSSSNASASHQPDEVEPDEPDTTEEELSMSMSAPSPAPAPFHELLRHSARATWRSSSQPPPLSLSHTRSHLLQRSGKTGRQLRRTHEHVVSVHQALADRRERERRDLVNARYRRVRPDSLEGRRRSAEDAQAARPITYGPEQTLASVRFRLVPNFFLARRVLAEARSLLGGGSDSESSFAPKRIIDAGCGVGSSSAAALDVFGADSVDWIHCIDPSRSMRDGCVEVLQGMIDGEGMTDDEDDDALLGEEDRAGESRRGQRRNKQQQQRRNASARRTRITLSETLSDGINSSTSSSSSGGGGGGGNNARRKQNQRANVTAGSGGTGSFDLALCTYTASELPHVASSMAMAAILWEKLAPNGVLVMIEPGTPDGFSSIRAVRNMLLDCCPPDDRHRYEEDEYGGEGMGRQEGDEEAHIIAPCTHAHACPMERHQKDHLGTKRGWSEEFGIDDSGDNYDDDADDDPDVDAHPDWNDDDDDELDYMDATEPAASTMKAAKTAGETTAFERAFCSFVHAMPGGDNRSRGEKFSYLVVQKRVAGASPSELDLDRANNPFHGEMVTDLLAASILSGNESTEGSASRKKKHLRQVGNVQKHSGLIQYASDLEDRFCDSDADELALELVRGDAARSSFGRIVRAPLKRKGLIMVDYCAGAPEGADSAAADGIGDDAGSEEKKGRIIRHKVSRRVSSRVAPGLYAAARKARWGGLWPDINDRVDSEGSGNE